MKSVLRNVALCAFSVIILLLPFVLHAQGGSGGGGGGPSTNLIVCDDSPNQSANPPLPPCDFNTLITLAKNFMNFMIVMAIPLAAISFVFAGYKLLTSGGSESAKNDAKRMFTNTGIGLVIVLAAWLVVNTLLTALLANSSFSLLGP